MELLSSKVAGGHTDLIQNFLHSQVQSDMYFFSFFCVYSSLIGSKIIAITLQAAGQFLDLSVITGDGVRDDCHTLVLAACSPVFTACSPSPDSCLLLPDFASIDFINLLGVLYGGPAR